MTSQSYISADLRLGSDKYLWSAARSLLASGEGHQTAELKWKQEESLSRKRSERKKLHVLFQKMFTRVDQIWKEFMIKERMPAFIPFCSRLILSQCESSSSTSQTPHVTHSLAIREWLTDEAAGQELNERLWEISQRDISTKSQGDGLEELWENHLPEDCTLVWSEWKGSLRRKYFEGDCVYHW